MEGIQRIQEMAKGQKDTILLEIVKHLITRTDMNEKYLNEEKDLKGMANYIQGQILSDFCKKMNTKNPSSLASEVKFNGKSARCLGIGMSEEETFELAIKYFNQSNKSLGINVEILKKENDTNNKDDEFGSIFETEEIAVQEEKEEIEQISLFVA